MSIKKVKVSNFKSFRDLDVELGAFNVLIGANASGKSNFIEIFRFLRDIANHGLRNAISMQGDIEYLRNTNVGKSSPLIVEFVSADSANTPFLVGFEETRIIEARSYEFTYRFELKFNDNPSEFELSEDKLTIKCDFFEGQRKRPTKERNLGKGEIRVLNKAGKVDIQVNIAEGLPAKIDPVIFPFRSDGSSNLPSKTLLLERPSYIPLYPRFGHVLTDLSLYDFDPKLPKRAVPITGKRELEEDGSNLAIVLKNIIEDEKKKRKFSNLVKDLLPFVDDFNVAKYADKSLIFELREIYSKNFLLPASLMSDGTINITALIIALYFEEKPLVVFEEPERNIHPFLISRLVDMFKEVSKQKQIIVTTQNAEVVKSASLDSLMLISRNKEGFSTIIKPSEKEKVRAFLKNEIGIEELYVQNLLGA